MTQPSLYTLYACPCSQDSEARQADSNEDQAELSFNSHDPRSAYSLFSLDYLLFCDECNQIRCPRCVSEEVLSWYCPNCLFETHSTGVRGDGNRCSRNCCVCPICTSPAIVSRYGDDTSADSELYILACQYCDWTSLQADLKFAKPTKIVDQISKVRKERQATEAANHALLHDARSEKMSAFYKDLLEESNDLGARGMSGAYGSPANLARIIHMYGGLSHRALSKAQGRPQLMRDAGEGDGALYFDAESHETDIIQRLQDEGFTSTVGSDQQSAAPVNMSARLVHELSPVAVALRTRRGKRCRQCRQFVVRPDTKVTGMRYRIRIIARNNIPRLDIRPIEASKSLQQGDFALRQPHMPSIPNLRPFSTHQYVLTIRNPIFETVKITLATPATTPGPISSKVTILCPSFSIGPAGDIWDDALTASTSSHALTDGGRKAAMASLVGSSEAERQPEAGKVWEQSRNSTSVVVEVVIGAIPVSEGASKERNSIEIPVYVRAEWTAEGTDEDSKKGKPESKEISYWCVLGIGEVVQ